MEVRTKMSDVKVAFLTDSCSDIPQELTDKYGIDVIGFHIMLDGKEYLERKDITNNQFYEMMRQSIDDACTNYLNGETADDWDFAGLRRHFMNWLCLPSDFNYTNHQLGDLTKEGIADELYKRGMDILTARRRSTAPRQCANWSVSACCAMLTPSGWSTLTTWTS